MGRREGVLRRASVLSGHGRGGADVGVGWKGLKRGWSGALTREMRGQSKRGAPRAMRIREVEVAVREGVGREEDEAGEAAGCEEQADRAREGPTHRRCGG